MKMMKNQPKPETAPPEEPAASSHIEYEVTVLFKARRGVYSRASLELNVDETLETRLAGDVISVRAREVAPVARL